MRLARLSWILPLFALIGMTLLVSHGRGIAAQQAAALGFQQRENLEFLGLKAENLRLEKGQLSDADRKQLEDSSAEAQALRARLAALNQKLSKQEEKAAEVLHASDWVYSGHATPRATIESVLWAASRGETDRLAGLLGFAPELRAQALAMFQQLPAASQQEYGTPEKVIATLLAGNFPKDPESAQIIADHQFGDNDAAMVMSVSHLDGQNRLSQFQFRKADDGWKLLVPAYVMDDYMKMLQGEQQPTEAGPH